MMEITCKCGCGRKKEVRAADVKRGWGKYFSKSCKAKCSTASKTAYRKYLQRKEEYREHGFTMSQRDMGEGHVQ